MENKRIIYTTPEGTVSIIIPAPGATYEQLVAVVPPDTEHTLVDIDTIPKDRTFRNAWERSGSAIVHNLGKAKSIAHDRRRVKRAAELAPLDVEATIPAKASAAEAARQAIRDKHAVIQKNIDNAADIDALKAIIVSENL